MLARCSVWILCASIFLTTSSVQGLQLSEECKTLYAKLETFPTDNRSVPLFISNPGSGNTWLRLMMEFLTSRTTGSFHNDDSLYSDFSGENRCDNKQCFIKAHPAALDAHHVPYSEMVSKESHVRQKCSTGGLSSFDRFLFVIREPVASIWSTFHLILSGSHTGIFKAFPEERIGTFATQAPKWASTLQEHWEQLIYPRIVQFPDKVMTLKYENFINPALRYQEFRSMCSFVDCGDPSLFTKKLECALQFAERDDIHRKADVNLTSNKAPIDYKKMVFEKSPNLGCELYEIMKDLYKNFSYAPYSKTACNNNSNNDISN